MMMKPEEVGCLDSNFFPELERNTVCGRARVANISKTVNAEPYAGCVQESGRVSVSDKKVIFPC
jgi:hypothetical protein